MYMAAEVAGDWTPALYYILVVVLGNFVVLNLFLAILIDTFMQSNQEIVEKEKEAQKAARLKDYEREEHKHSLMTPPLEEEDREDDQTKKLGNKQVSTISIKSKASSHPDDLEDSDLLYQWVEKKSKDAANALIQVTVDNHPAYQANTHALGCFSPENTVRKYIGKLVLHKWFDRFILVVIALSCILLAVDYPNAVNEGQQYLDAFNLIFTVIFIVEAVLKVVAFGFIQHEGAYLRDNWNVLDFVIVVFSIIEIAFASGDTGAGGDLGTFKVLRAFRAARPLRVVRRFESLRIVVVSLGQSIVPVTQVGAIAILFYIIFAILCVSLFGGGFYSCQQCPSRVEDPSLLDSQCEWSTPLHIGPILASAYNLTQTPSNYQNCFPYRSYKVAECAPVAQCVGSQDGAYEWRLPAYDGSGGTVYSFDNAAISLLSLYEISSLELWFEPMYRATDITGVGKEPARGVCHCDVLFCLSILAINRDICCMIHS